MAVQLSLLKQSGAPIPKIVPATPVRRKAALGQFMTSGSVARFMAGLFPSSDLPTCRLLDAGAGMGELSAAFLDRWMKSDAGLDFQSVKLDTYEIDDSLRDRLQSRLEDYRQRGSFSFTAFSDDFIPTATRQILQDSASYSHAILNPPYKKISSESSHRFALRRVGIETVNLYSAFVALAIAQLQPGGHLVAILPRSFCNGPYYRAFREFILSRAALRHIHLFESRVSAFRHDNVLQENVIILLERGGQQGPVTITHSTDDTFSDLLTHRYDFSEVIFPDDPEQFIHIPNLGDDSLIKEVQRFHCTIDELGLEISTGPVVEFRLRKHIKSEPCNGSAPLLYPGHFSENRMHWPKKDIKGGNAIALNGETRHLLYPNGFYAVTRRFSSKEERRRIVASVVDPEGFEGAKMLGFENHLNVFHEKKHGLSPKLAYGMTAYLNTTTVDRYFRRFNGHTQVNATDLRKMKYPSRAALIELGEWARSRPTLTQSMLDDQIKIL